MSDRYTGWICPQCDVLSNLGPFKCGQCGDMPMIWYDSKERAKELRNEAAQMALDDSAGPTAVDIDD